MKQNVEAQVIYRRRESDGIGGFLDNVEENLGYLYGYLGALSSETGSKLYGLDSGLTVAFVTRDRINTSSNCFLRIAGKDFKIKKALKDRRYDIYTLELI